MKYKLSRFYGTLYRKTVEINDLTQLQGGWETNVYAFHLHAEGDDPRRLVIRLFPGMDGSSKARAEFQAMQRLYAAGYPVPQVYHLTPIEHSPFGQPFFVMDYIDGPSVAQALANAANPLIARSLFANYVQLLVDLHRLELGASLSNPFKTGNPYAFIDYHLKLMRQTGERYQLSDFAPVLAWLEGHRYSVPTERIVVTHNDYHPNNVLMDSDGSFKVIDWSNAQAGDPRYDIGWTWLLHKTYDHPETADEFTAIYSAFAEQELDQMGYFYVLAAVRRLGSILISIQAGAEQMGMNPDAINNIANRDHLAKVYTVLQTYTDLRVGSIERFLAD